MNGGVARAELSLRRPLVASALLHLLLVAGFLYSRSAVRAPSPPMYRVSLTAAPPGPRQTGVVSEAPPPATAPAAPTPPAPTPKSPAPAAPTPPAARSRPEPDRMRAPTRAPPTREPRAATPSAGTGTAPVPAEAPRAGGGPQGGRGADVANVRTEGIEFPYPVYLQNVVRQIALQFKPSNAGALRADVAFLIRRDGSIAGLKLVTRSGVFSFDQDALGAVEAAARVNAFGPLPEGFTDDVLPVIFSFDPRLIR